MTSPASPANTDTLAKALRDRVIDLAASPHTEYVPSAVFYEAASLLPPTWVPSLAELTVPTDEQIEQAGALLVLSTPGYVTLTWSQTLTGGPAIRVDSSLRTWPSQLSIRTDTTVMRRAVGSFEANSVRLLAGEQLLLELPSARSQRSRHDYLQALAEIVAAQSHL